MDQQCLASHNFQFISQMCTACEMEKWWLWTVFQISLNSGVQIARNLRGRLCWLLTVLLCLPADDEYLTGVLRVRVVMATDVKAKPGMELQCYRPTHCMCTYTLRLYYTRMRFIKCTCLWVHVCNLVIIVVYWWVMAQFATRPVLKPAVHFKMG